MGVSKYIQFHDLGAEDWERIANKEVSNLPS